MYQFFSTTRERAEYKYTMVPSEIQALLELRKVYKNFAINIISYLEKATLDAIKMAGGKSCGNPCRFSERIYIFSRPNGTELSIRKLYRLTLSNETILLDYSNKNARDNHFQFMAYEYNWNGPQMPAGIDLNNRFFRLKNSSCDCFLIEPGPFCKVVYKEKDIYLDGRWHGYQFVDVPYREYDKVMKKLQTNGFQRPEIYIASPTKEISKMIDEAWATLRILREEWTKVLNDLGVEYDPKDLEISKDYENGHQKVIKIESLQ